MTDAIRLRTCLCGYSTPDRGNLSRHRKGCKVAAYAEKVSLLEQELYQVKHEKEMVEGEYAILKSETGADRMMELARTQLAQKDEIIARKEEALASVIAKKDEIIAKKDEITAKKDEIIAEKDAEIKRLNSMLIKKPSHVTLSLIHI